MKLNCQSLKVIESFFDRLVAADDDNARIDRKDVLIDRKE